MRCGYIAAAHRLPPHERVQGTVLSLGILSVRESGGTDAAILEPSPRDWIRIIDSSGNANNVELLIYGFGVY